MSARAGWAACDGCGVSTPYRLAVENNVKTCCGKLACEAVLQGRPLHEHRIAQHDAARVESVRVLSATIEAVREILRVPSGQHLIAHARLLRTFVDAIVRLSDEPNFNNSGLVIAAMNDLGLNDADDVGASTKPRKELRHGEAAGKAVARVGSADAEAKDESRVRLAVDPSDAQSKGENNKSSHGGAADAPLTGARDEAPAARTPLSGVLVDLDAIETRFDARTDMPALCAEVRRLELQRARWQAFCETRVLKGIQVLLAGGIAEMSPLEILQDLQNRIGRALAEGPPPAPSEVRFTHSFSIDSEAP